VAVSVSVFLSRDRLPTALEWQRALDDAGLPLQLDTSVNLNDLIGFLPVSDRGQESGFEYFVQQDVPYPDAAPLFRIDTLDTCVTLVTRSPLETRTACAAAAALAVLTGGRLRRCRGPRIRGVRRHRMGATHRRRDDGS